MRNGKYAARRSSGTKVFSLMLAALLLVGCSIGATLAWLTATTNVVENTFTVGKVAITLQEHKYVEATNSLDKTVATVQSNEYKLIPGKNMPKDPYVTVVKGSEKCWLFVAIQETNNVLGGGQAVNFDVNDGDWTEFYVGNEYDLKEGVAVYYTIVDSDASSDQDFYVLRKEDNCTANDHTNGCVTVHEAIDSTWSDSKVPTLTFNAAAIQYDGLEPADASDDARQTAAINAFFALPSDFVNNCVTKVTTAPET